MRTFLCAAAGALLLSGCATIRRSNTFHGVKVEDGEIPLEIVEIENSGWEMFKFIPLGSGDTRYPNRLACRFFMDTVTLQNNLNLLEMEMKAKGVRRFTNLVSRNSEESFLFILLTRNAYHTSAVLLKDEDTPTPTPTAGRKEGEE